MPTTSNDEKLILKWKNILKQNPKELKKLLKELDLSEMTSQKN